MKAAGVATLPVVSSDDSDFFEAVKRIEIAGAAASALAQMFPENTGPGSSTNRTYWQDIFSQQMKIWKEGKGIPAALLGGSNDVSPSSYFTKNPDQEQVLGDLAGASLNKISEVF